MMWFAIFSSLLLSVVTPKPTTVAPDESFQVVFVQGTMVNKQTGAAIARGAKLSANDKIQFKSKDAKAVVMSTAKGRFVMTSKQPSNSEFADFVKSVVSPLKTNSKLSTRGVSKIPETGLVDMGIHFGSMTSEAERVPIFAILGDEYTFTVALSRFPVTANQKGQIISISGNTPKPFNLPFIVKGDQATISKKQHFKNFDVKDVRRVDVRLFDRAGKKFLETYATFRPIFIDKEDLKGSYTEFLSLTDDKDAALLDFMKSGYESNEAKSKEMEDRFGKMNAAERKVQLFFYFLASCYGEMNDQGVIDVEKFNVDYSTLEKWLKENNI